MRKDRSGIKGTPPPVAPEHSADPTAEQPPQPKAMYGKFDRLNMLKDKSGNYVYPDFDIEINAESGFMKSKSEVFNTLSNLAGQGRFEPNPGNLTFLKLLTKLGVPDQQMVIADMAANIKQVQAIPLKENTAAKVPSESISFKDMPDAGKIQMAAQAGIQLQPQDLAQLQQALAQAKAPIGAQPSPSPTTSPTTSPQDTQGQTQAQGGANIPPETMKAIRSLS